MGTKQISIYFLLYFAEYSRLYITELLWDRLYFAKKKIRCNLYYTEYINLKLYYAEIPHFTYFHPFFPQNTGESFPQNTDM